jgi:1-acyl-sn-glycerol-3-phosphate acyltransferase
MELAAWPILGTLLRRLGVVYVARSDPEKCTEVIQAAATAGRDFLFFPEGTFRRMPGLLPFHLGAFVAAARSGAAVVPIALQGTRAVLRGGDWLPRRHPIRVVFGEPLRPQASDDLFREAVRLSAAARRFILAHCDEPDLGDAVVPDAAE